MYLYGVNDEMDVYIQTQLSSMVDSFSVSLLILSHFLKGGGGGGGSFDGISVKWLRRNLSCCPEN